MTLSSIRMRPDVIDFETRHHPQRRCLAAAGRPDEDDEFLVANPEVHVLDRVDLVELLVQALYMDLCHRSLTRMLSLDRPGQAGDVMLDKEGIDKGDGYRAQ